MKKQPVVRLLQLPAIKTLLARLVDARHHGFRFPLLAALVILGSAWLFLGVLEDVATRDPLVEVDVVVHGVLQQLRTPWMDSVMVAITELGDVQVLLPVVAASLAWFLWHRLWWTSLYVLAAVGMAQLLVKLLKLALHRSRPGLFYEGLESFAFPSGHATMSVVAYGFLAFLICRKQRATIRILIAATAALGIALIALSRLYLGVHWASDVIAGASFGLAWIGALAMAYTYRTDEDVKPKQLAIVLMAILLVSGSWHIRQSHGRDSVRYAPLPTSSEVQAGWVQTVVLTRKFSAPVNPSFCPSTPSMLGREVVNLHYVGRVCLAVSAGVPGLIGFAVGRTTFLEPLIALRDEKITRATAVAEIARRYRQWVDVFELAQATVSVSDSALATGPAWPPEG